MKVVIALFAILILVDAIAILPRHNGESRRSRLRWLKMKKAVEIGVTFNVQTTPGYYYGSTQTYPWGYPTSPTPWWGYPTTPGWNPYQTTRPYTYDYWGTTTRYTNYWEPATTPTYWNGSPTPSYGYCPYGTIASMDKRQCFKLNYDELTFIEAEQSCQKQGGHLASIHNAFDNVLLNDYARNMYGTESKYYIGANDLTNNRVWGWTDYSRFDYQDWYNSQSGGEFLDCAQVITTHGAWIKVDCYTRSPYACSFDSYWKK